MRKYTPEQYKLCKLLQSFSDPSNKAHCQQAQFDDKGISKTPTTILTHRFKDRPFLKQDKEARLEKKKKVIKNRIQDQLRNQIRRFGSNDHFIDMTKDQQSPSKRTESVPRVIQPEKVNSEIIRIRKFPTFTQQKQSQPSSCTRFSLQDINFIKQKSLDIRKRYVHTSRTPARKANMVRQASNKQRSPLVMNNHNPETHGEDLEPWRYAQEIQIDEPLFMRKRLAIR